MYRAVRNSAINVAKRKKYLISIHDFPIDTFSIANPMEKFDLNLDAFIKLLPNKQREAFNLFSQGYSHKEIAVQLDLDSEGASRNLIYYAKKNLKKLISDLPEFDPDDRGPFNSSRDKAKKHTDPNRRALNINPGSTPKVKDLLSFISGGALKAGNRKAILQWLINENFAFEIISGIQIALKNNRANSIEARIRNDKNNLRAQLFGSSNQPEVQNKQKHLLSLRPDLKNKLSLATNLIDHKADRNELPIIDSTHGFDMTWIELQRKISLNYNKNNILIEFEVPGAHRNDLKARAYTTCLLFNQQLINPIKNAYHIVTDMAFRCTHDTTEKPDQSSGYRFVKSEKHCHYWEYFPIGL
jgi:hypothetical protein